MSIRKCLVGVVLLLCTAQVNAETVRFWIQDLGLLELPGDPLGPKGYSKGFGINNYSVVVGTSTTATLGVEHAFRQDTVFGSGIEDLGSVGNANSSASGVNRTGQVAGTLSAGGTDQAYRYAGGIQVLDSLAPGTSSNGSGINDSGKVVGNSKTAGGSTHAVLWNEAGAIQDLNPLGASSSYATAINNSDEVVGYSTASSVASAFVYDGAFRDLGTFVGGTHSWGMDINKYGQVVGQATTAGGATHAFFDDGVMQDLGTLGGDRSFGFGISDHGLVVGASTVTPGGSDYSAFVYNETWGMLDLNDMLVDAPAGWTLQYAYDVGTNGKIIGYGDFNGETRAFLLSPVPEPSTLAALLSLGLVGLFGFWRRSRKAA